MGGSINSVLGFSGVRLDGKEVDAWYVKFDKKDRHLQSTLTAGVEDTRRISISRNWRRQLSCTRSMRRRTSSACTNACYMHGILC